MKILKIIPKDLKSALKQAVLIIKKRGVVVYPTDTVYGLIADAENYIAVEKVFKVKKRKFGKPLPVFVKNINMAKRLAHIDKVQEKILKKFWPGGLTAVLKARPLRFPKGILSKDKKIGLRVPDYKLLNLLLEKTNRPLVATSANISGQKASGKILEVLKQFKYKKNKPDLVVSAGNLKPSVSSTVVDLTNFEIIRKGVISKKQILDEFKK
jgi:L-threonylcarbamoyladenylate synthase